MEKVVYKAIKWHGNNLKQVSDFLHTNKYTVDNDVLTIYIGFNLYHIYKGEVIYYDEHGQLGFSKSSEDRVVHISYNVEK